MNKKAFTLVELLAVIVILGILSAVVAINVSKYLDNTYDESFRILVESIESSTEAYLADHSSEYPALDVAGSTFNIQLSDLVNDNRLNSHLVDERTDTEIPLTTTITITVITKDKIDIDLNYD